MAHSESFLAGRNMAGSYGQGLAVTKTGSPFKLVNHGGRSADAVLLAVMLEMDNISS